jgi:oligogalacturonide lyase
MSTKQSRPRRDVFIRALSLTLALAAAHFGRAADRPSELLAPIWLPSEMRVFTDPRTGVPLTALTTSGANDDKIYQTHPSWTFDGRHVVFVSDRSGSSEAYLVRVDDGRIGRLAVDEPLNTGQLCLSRQGNRLVGLSADRVVLVDFDALANNAADSSARPTVRVVGRIPRGARVSGTVSWDCDEQAVYLGLEWSEHPPAGRWSIHRLDIGSGDVVEIVSVDFRVGHVQANPWETGWVMYCQETGGDAAQRMWVVRADGEGNRPLYRETFGEWVTHEVWWDARRALFTIWPKDEKMRSRPHGIASIDLDGTFVLHSQFPYWHVTGARGSRYAVADTFAGDIFRVDLETGEKILLTAGHRTGLSGPHPHPTLRPDGRQVLFVSHHFGNPDLFLVELPPEEE